MSLGQGFQKCESGHDRVAVVQTDGQTVATERITNHHQHLQLVIVIVHSS